METTTMETTIVSQRTIGLRTRVWGNYVLETRKMIGTNGYRGTGINTHVVFAEYIVGLVDVELEKSKAHGTVGHEFLRSGKPTVFTAGSPCNSNGQRVSRVQGEFDATKVTCKSCRRKLGLDRETTTN